MTQGKQAALAQHSRASKTIGVDVRNFSYLFRRAGFGATQEEIQAATHRGLAATISHLVHYDALSDTQPSLPVVTDIHSGQAEQLAAWWFRRMVTTEEPLQEKMTLFWHGHFATSVQKVRSPLYMATQNQLFRRQAMGRFDDLLSAVYRDPAMLIWLDGYRNTKYAPNENWGREVMELFTLGHGAYDEDDVHACSRAFTGWRLGPDGTPFFVPRLHDDGIKTLLGETGNWNADDAVRILAAHRATGPFLAGKLWRFFASDQPPSPVISKLSRVYYSSDHSIRAMMLTL